MKQLSETTKGIFLLILSAFFFAFMAVFIRLAGNIFFVQKAFFRNAVAFFIALAGIFLDTKKQGKAAYKLPEGSFKYLFLRAAAGSLGIFGNFYAVDHLVLSDAAILNKMAPFFAILFSFFLLKEKIRLVPFLAILTAFAGSVLIVKPSFDFSQMLPSLAGMAGGIGAGFAYACVRKLSVLKCPGKMIVLFFSGFSMLLSVPYMIVNFNPMTLMQLLMLVGAGICGAGGQFTITAAYYHAPAREISIYDYTQIIFSTALGFIFFSQVPDVLSFIGYGIIILMAFVNYYYNLKLHKKNAENPIKN